MSLLTLVNNPNTKGNLALSADQTTLYGTDYDGNFGHIFSVPTNGGSITILHSFNGTDGQNPNGQLLLIGNILYGSCSAGGDNGVGNIFSYDIGTQILTSLYSFTGGNNGNDGAFPKGGLTISGNTLYGTCLNYDNIGAIFSYDIGGTFTILYPFNATSGSNPNGGLLLIGNSIYGTCNNDGPNLFGTIFSYELSPTPGFNLLYSFNLNDGVSPNGGLLLIGSTLYGTCNTGGSNFNGTIFSYDNTQTPTFGAIVTLYTFDNYPAPRNPNGNLIVVGNTIYGTCQNGGANSNGIIFSYDNTQTPGTGTIVNLYSFTGNFSTAPNGGLLSSNNHLFGTTNGTIFSFGDPPICFDESVKILCLVNNQEVYTPISKLSSGNLIKTYNHEYLPIKSIGSNTMMNNPNNWQTCMYRLPKNTIKNQTDDLIVTGGHAICVDSLTSEQLRLQSQWWVNGISQIDDKFRLLSSLDSRFEKITENKQFTYYHLILEGHQERYGIYANGVLSETCTPKVFEKYNFMNIR